ncbi:DUF3618 domain-containing protein [Streptomyces sp. JJ36]|uniref:DUF3618 domain-containing protein n=1 Tax=Streptomyces sp. JJ36 TaxID=2736645 RepID=UPI001F2661DA|nr:DUF3618 domain-containing protein [Streptomyces sp. JJ36]MCF6523158.1 DUF3618 domain-containing protein [Streptomyces sp. JJ36]
MTRADHNGHGAASTQELHAEVEHARDQLADTVSQLAAKADLSARARTRARETRERMQHGGRRAAEKGGGTKGAVIASGAGVLCLAVLAARLYRRRPGLGARAGGTGRDRPFTVVVTRSVGPPPGVGSRFRRSRSGRSGGYGARWCRGAQEAGGRRRR